MSRQKTIPVRMYVADHDRMLELCIDADKDAAGVMREIFIRLNQQAEQIRYLELDRARLLRERNEFERIVKRGA